jgi:hypothetical protein
MDRETALKVLFLDETGGGLSDRGRQAEGSINGRAPARGLEPFDRVHDSHTQTSATQDGGDGCHRDESLR